jgi:hypothetical protein
MLVHWGITTWTRSRYSHCELFIDGICYSASDRDGGVRGKIIDLDSGKWDVYDIDGDAEYAKQWFLDRINKHRYDYAGVLRFVFPWIKIDPNKWFCSEACAEALKLHRPETYSPEDLFKTIVRK